jgi:hypothetical protein
MFSISGVKCESDAEIRQRGIQRSQKIFKTSWSGLFIFIEDSNSIKKINLTLLEFSQND